MSSINPNEILGRVLWDNRLRNYTWVEVGGNSFESGTFTDIIDYQSFTYASFLTLSPQIVWEATVAQDELATWTQCAAYWGAYDEDGENNTPRIAAQVTGDVSGNTTVVIISDPEGNLFTLQDVDLVSHLDPTDVTAEVRIRFYGESLEDELMRVRQLFIGPALEFDRGQWAGIKPSILQTQVKKSLSIATNGAVVGSNVIRPVRKDNIAMEHLPRAFVELEWLPFAIHAQTKPFFWQYDPVGDPDSITFSSAESTPNPENQTIGLMSVSMPIVHDASDQ